MKRGTEFVIKAVLILLRECYGDNKLKRKDVKPTKPVDFEGTARYQNISIMSYESKKR